MNKGALVKYTHRQLLQEFDQQAERLYQLRESARNNLPHAGQMLDAMFASQIEALRKKVPNNLMCLHTDLPLLVVVPDMVDPVTWQISLIQYNGNRGYTFLPIAKSWLPYFVSNMPYLSMCVENGAKQLGVCPERSLEMFADKKREGFSLEEGTALAIHKPQVFASHNIHMPNALIQGEDGKQYVLDYWVYADQIKLKRDPGYCADKRWGSPSCSRRITLD